MKSLKKLAVIFLCITALLSLMGCKIKDRFILDGPGMENTLSWDSFSVSRSDSYAQHNFYITVKYYVDGYVVKGTLLDTDGTEYEDYEGIVLPKEACQKIDALYPHNLPNLISGAVPEAGMDDELIILDAPEVKVEVGNTNGTLLEKADENDFSIRVYEIVLPYFREKFN